MVNNSKVYQLIGYFKVELESRFAIFACLEVLVSGSLVKSLQTLSRSPFMEFERSSISILHFSYLEKAI
ncbi:12329_t:CDS:2 [Entrophospora sp. SA101]|nr:12329_t:CDS:2 [Entrophospora sp. SA101]